MQCRRSRFDRWVRKIPWRRKGQPTPVFLPGKSHGQRHLAGYSPQGHKELDTAEWWHFHSHILCYGTWRRPFFSFKNSHFLSFILCRVSILEQTNWHHIAGNSKQRLRNHNRSFYFSQKENREPGSFHGACLHSEWCSVENVYFETSTWSPEDSPGSVLENTLRPWGAH